MILHIANDYTGSKVYSNLITELDKMGISQTVFTTAREAQDEGKNFVEFSNKNSKIIYSKNWCPIHKLCFKLKASSNYKNVLKLIDCRHISHVHSHTLFSDGVLAMKLKEEYNIPYTVTVRNTDINIFMNFMLHTWHIGRQVILNADQVVCISPAHVKKVRKWIACPIKSYDSKVVNIPNGVSKFWLDKIACSIHPHHIGQPWQIIYVGNFSPNKNIPRLMNAIIRLHKEGLPVTLHIVGGVGKDECNINKIAKSHTNLFVLHGIVNDGKELQTLYAKSNIFAMPSLHETFGLVYVEALSQGLPILYTNGEGVDGFFSEKYGMNCNANSVDSIFESLKFMILNYNTFDIDQSFILGHFNWSNIAKQYIRLYNI